MTRLTPGAIILRTIALTSAVTISACLVVREQDRADQASQPRQEEVPSEPAPQDELAGPEAPMSDEEIFLSTSKSMAPPGVLDPSIFLSTSKSAAINVQPEVFLPSSKSLVMSPSFAESIAEHEKNGNRERHLLERQARLQAELAQVRLELEVWRAQQAKEKQSDDKED